MKTSVVVTSGLFVIACSALRGAPDPQWLGHDRDRPAPAVITPGTGSTQEQPGTPPSDATVLFDGKDVSAWVAMDGSLTKWIVHDGALECVPGSGYVRTLQSFGDCQLHVEWAAPTPPKGTARAAATAVCFSASAATRCKCWIPATTRPTPTARPPRFTASIRRS